MCSDLPVLRIDSIKKLNRSTLSSKKYEIIDKDFFNDKLTITYWIKKSKKVKKKSSQNIIKNI